jgi:hypothetical protein
MKNPYTKIAKDMNNSDTLIAKRIGDDVYITNSYWAAKVDYYVYASYLRNGCMRLIHLEDGDQIRSNNKKQQCEKVPVVAKIEELFKNDFPIPVTITPLKIELKKDNKSSYDARILKSQNAHWCIQETYYQIALELGWKEIKAGGENNGGTPLLFEVVDGLLLVLPIRTDANANEWIKAV